jgi:hypothetical protein
LRFGRAEVKEGSLSVLPGAPVGHRMTRGRRRASPERKSKGTTSGAAPLTVADVGVRCPAASESDGAGHRSAPEPFHDVVRQHPNLARRTAEDRSPDRALDEGVEA